MGAVMGLLLGIVGGFYLIQVVFARNSASSSQILWSVLLAIPITTLLGAVIGLLWSRR